MDKDRGCNQLPAYNLYAGIKQESNTINTGLTQRGCFYYRHMKKENIICFFIVANCEN